MKGTAADRQAQIAFRMGAAVPYHALSSSPAVKRPGVLAEQCSNPAGPTNANTCSRRASKSGVSSGVSPNDHFRFVIRASVLRVLGARKLSRHRSSRRSNKWLLSTCLVSGSGRSTESTASATPTAAPTRTKTPRPRGWKFRSDLLPPSLIPCRGCRELFAPRGSASRTQRVWPGSWTWPPQRLGAQWHLLCAWWPRRWTRTKAILGSASSRSETRRERGHP